jgi:hypothetical protein
MQQACLLPGARLERWTGIELGHVQPGGSANMPVGFIASNFQIDSDGDMNIAGE